MNQSKFTPLRAGLLIMLGILVLGSLVYRYLPGRYSISASKSSELIEKERSLTPDQFMKEVTGKDKHTIILDLRGAEAFQAGHVEGAFNLNEKELLKRKEIRRMKKGTVLIYSNDGASSAKAAFLLQMTGIHARALDRGYEEMIIAEKGKTSGTAFRSAEIEKYPYKDYFKALQSTGASPAVEVKVPVPKSGGC
jgi:rhodanese-related sulfurtransferase